MRVCVTICMGVGEGKFMHCEETGMLRTCVRSRNSRVFGEVRLSSTECETKGRKGNEAHTGRKGKKV